MTIGILWRGILGPAISMTLFAGNGFVGQSMPEVDAKQDPKQHTALSVGSEPLPLVFPHFPDRLHTFIWRNWTTVEPARLAKILHTPVANVTALATSMGLPPAGDSSPDMVKRGYISLLRRNWHLLPYEQLLELVEMTPARLASVLVDEDGVLVKLGNLKPKCEPLYYTEPDAAAKRRSAEIRRAVEDSLGDEIRRPGEPRFAFVHTLSDPLSPVALPKRNADQHASLRYIYSYFAPYGDPLLDNQLDPYPDGFLQRLSSVGINGVWLHVVLRDLAPGGPDFPEFGEGHAARLANLRAIVAKAKRYGIGVYLYINEPRGMPKEFFRTRPDMQGVDNAYVAGQAAMCTSHPTVRNWIRNSLEYIFRETPELAGVFTITASENLTNCAAHGNRRNCPRCKERTDAEVIAEVNHTIAEGVHRGNPQAKVICWDWGWHRHGDAPDVIAKLPKSAWLMSVSEWGVPIDRGGLKTTVGEYCISAAGPGPRATSHWTLAKQLGQKTIAKVQVNNTWELSTVPYLPVMDLVAEHCHNLASAGVDGMMLSWSLGGYPSPNLEIAARMQQTPTPIIAEVLDAVATKNYGAAGAPHARKAWAAFSDAFRQYPFNIGVLYCSPVQMGPANLLYENPTGFGATMTGIPYDDVDSWRGPYPASVLAERFENVATDWSPGIAELRTAVESSPPELHDAAQAELRVARAARLHFQSVANQTRYTTDRNRLADTAQNISPEERRQLVDEMRRCIESEILLAREMYTLAKDDSRLGFEAANHYFYLPQDLAEKVVNCRWLLDRLEPIQEEPNHTAMPLSPNYARPCETEIKPALLPLPLGAVEPAGWLRDWAVAARNGITGHLDEHHAVFREGWKGTSIETHHPNPDSADWPLEQSAYWLDGAIRLGYILHDQSLINKIRARLDPVVDGVNKAERGTSLAYWKMGVKPHGFLSWAHSQMGRALVAMYQGSGEKRALDALVKVYAEYPEDMGGLQFDDVSGLCNLDAMMETYSYSGNPRIIARALAAIHQASVAKDIKAWCDGQLACGHTVITYENLRLPAVMYPWTGDPRHLRATQKAFQWLDEHHMQPYGVASGEEFVAGAGSLRKTETCNVPAMLLASSWMYRIEGDGAWGDRMEKAFFNAGAAPIARDFKTVSYYQSPNRICDGTLPTESTNPGKGCLRYTPLACPNVLCCAGAVNRIIPYFVGNMWMATRDNGLAATLYGPCAVSAMVGPRVAAKLTVATDYPFNETIRITVDPSEPVAFPLYLRIPKWCAQPEIRVNATTITIKADPERKAFVRIERTWAKGDAVTLALPMRAKMMCGHENEYPTALRSYFSNEPKSLFENRRLPYASVTLGPLLFALPIPDKDENTPVPGAKWQYALDIDTRDAATTVVDRKPMPARWDWLLDAPVVLEIPARAFDWRPTSIQALPVAAVADGPRETIRLVPYGCAKFRISMFPVYRTSRSSQVAAQR